MSMSVFSRIISDFVLFLALNDEATVDPDEAATMRDWLVARLREMEAPLLQLIMDDLKKENETFLSSEQYILRDITLELSLRDLSTASDQEKINELNDNRIFCQLARVIADIHLFLELTGEDKLNLDDAVKMMEFMAGSLSELENPFLRALIDAFQEIAPEYGEAGEAAVRDIARAYGLEEVLAADDPVRLAELEALDDAHEIEGRGDPLEDFPGVDWRADVRRPFLAVG